MPNISKKVLESAPVFLPPEDIQKDIADIEEHLSLTIIEHQKKLALFKDLFRTLLHQLMTAQIRVNDIDLSELKAIGIEVD